MATADPEEGTGSSETIAAPPPMGKKTVSKSCRRNPFIGVRTTDFSNRRSL